MCYPQQLGRSWKVFVPEPSGSSSAMCTGHLTNSVCYLHWNHPELHRPSEPEPSGTSLAMTRTVRKLVCFCHFAIELSTHLAYYLHRKPPQPCLLSAPRLSGTSSAICPGTLRNLISHLHHNPPEPSGTFSGTWCCSCTGSHQSYSGLKTP